MEILYFVAILLMIAASGTNSKKRRKLYILGVLLCIGILVTSIWWPHIVATFFIFQKLVLNNFPRYYLYLNISSLKETRNLDFTVFSRIFYRCCHRNWQFNYQTRNFARVSFHKSPYGPNSIFSAITQSSTFGF